MSTEVFAAVRACAIAMLSSAILRSSDVTAGNGIVVDWSTEKSGEKIQRGADAFDTARLFVSLVGPDDAYGVAMVGGEIEPAPAAKDPPARITAWRVDPCGGRRRSFDAGAFRVYVEPNEDDEAQAAFVARLAAFCVAEGGA